MSASLKTLLDELDTILERERTAILKGDYQSVAALLPQKEAVLKSLKGQVSIDDTRAQTVEKKIERNNALLRNAADGFRAAQQRLAQSRLSRMSLQTYDAFCRRHVCRLTQNLSLEKRA